jgi:hypothetical protein
MLHVIRVPHLAILAEDGEGEPNPHALLPYSLSLRSQEGQHMMFVLRRDPVWGAATVL